MARKAGTRVAFKTKSGQNVSFVAKNKVKRTVTRAKKPQAVKAAAAPKMVVTAIKAKRVATPKQLAALADARAKRTNAKLARMYGPGGGLPVGGPSSGVASLTEPAQAFKTGNPYADIGTPSAVKSGNPYADIGV